MTVTAPGRLSAASARSAMIVEGLYGAFQRRDIEAITDALTDDVVWSEPSNPWNPTAGTFKGPAGVAKWLQLGRESEEILELLPREFIAKGDIVVVVGHMVCRAKPTGRVYESDFVHVIEVRGDKIARFEEFFDTWAAAEAFKPELNSAIQDLSDVSCGCDR